MRGIKGCSYRFWVRRKLRRYTSYVCLRPNADFFSIIGLAIPEPKAYYPKQYTDKEIARYADDSFYKCHDERNDGALQADRRKR